MHRFTAVHRVVLVPLVSTLALASLAMSSPAAAAGTAMIVGTAFEDGNRNGILDAGETPWSGQQIYLFDASGRNIAVSWTDSSGAYAFGDLANGEYRVAYASPSWSPLKMDWTPTTTGTWRPTSTIQLMSSARVDFGWRRIVRSSDLQHPIAIYKAATGLTVQLYNDAVSPVEVAQLVAQGGLVGEEAATITVRVDGSDYTATGSSYSSSGGSYAGYAAIITIDWATWLAANENALFHEYGHAWSGYFSVMVQKDPSLTEYLRARGLAGDPRVDSTYGWSRYELIAEDYRQLYGTPAARAGAQANGELAPAAGVPGLSDFLAGTFRQPPPPPPPDPSVSITSLGITPRPVTKTGTVSYSLGKPATVTVTITTAGGGPVRTLTSGLAEPAGVRSLTWDRRDAKGRRVAAGTYIVKVTASAQGVTTTASVDFPVA